MFLFVIEPIMSMDSPLVEAHERAKAFFSALLNPSLVQRAFNKNIPDMVELEVILTAFPSAVFVQPYGSG
jgi:hypothetical protein